MASCDFTGRFLRIQVVCEIAAAGREDVKYNEFVLPHAVSFTRRALIIASSDSQGINFGQLAYQKQIRIQQHLMIIIQHILIINISHQWICFYIFFTYHS